VCVGVEELRAIGRPGRRVVERRLGEGDRARRRDAVLRRDHELVGTAGIGEVGHRPAVRRPGRRTFGAPVGAREVAPVALLGRDGEDLAARLDGGTLSGGREGDVADAVADLLPLWHEPREVAADRDGEALVLAGARVERVQVAALLEDDQTTARIERLHVEVGELRELLEGLGLRVVRPDVVHAVAIGGEVDHVADPRRVDVLRIGPGGRRQFVAGQVEDPDRPVLPAAIVASFIVPRAVHAIGDAPPVRSNLPLEGARHRERRLHIALRRDGPELRLAVGRRARRRKHDARAVGRPPLHHVRPRVPREATRLATVHRDDIGVGVAGILAAEGDPLPVRREARIGRDPLEGRHAASIAPIARCGPDVVGVREGDVRRTNGRLPEEPSLRAGGAGGGEGGKRRKGGVQREGKSTVHRGGQE
jgi:hypothetical protein